MLNCNELLIGLMNSLTSFTTSSKRCSSGDALSEDDCTEEVLFAPSSLALAVFAVSIERPATSAPGVLAMRCEVAALLRDWMLMI